MSMYGETKRRKDGRVKAVNNEPSMTRESFSAECDINEILKRAEKTGLVSHLNANPGAFLDLTGLPDYREALEVVIEADSAFMSLPAETRLRFANDPAKLISFLEDPKNRPEAERLGLVLPKAPVEGAAGAGSPKPEVSIPK